VPYLAPGADGGVTFGPAASQPEVTEEPAAKPAPKKRKPRTAKKPSTEPA